MNKILRYSLVTLLAMMSTAIFAKDDVVIDFNSMDLPMSWAANKDQGIEASNDGDITQTWSTTVDGITIQVSPKDEGVSNSNRFWKTNSGPQLRCYSGTITISASESMKSITFDAPSKFNLTAANGEISGTSWSGESATVDFTVGGNTQINKITISFNGGSTPTPTPTLPAADSQLDVPTAWDAIDQGLEEGKSSADKYYVSGIITSIDEISPKLADGTGYGNATFNITDAQGSNYVLVVFRAKGFNNAEITDENFIKVGDNVTVYGKLQKYKDSKTGEIKYEISSCYITSVNGKTGEDTPPQVAEAGSIGRLSGINSNTTVKLSLNNAVVVQSWTSNNGNTQVFVRDNTGACQFYNIGFDLKVGDVLNGTITAMYVLYNGNPELKDLVENNLQIGAGTAAPQANKIEIAQAEDYLCDYVEFSGVSLIEMTNESGAKATRAAGNYYIIRDDSDNEMQIYNGFHYGEYDDLHEFVDETDNTTIKGIVMKMSKGDLELFIMEIISDPAGVTTLNNDAKANGPIYNMAGQRVEKALKGVYIQNGKKFIVK